MNRWAAICVMLLLGCLGMAWVSFSSYFTGLARFTAGGMIWVTVYLIWGTYTTDFLDPVKKYIRAKRKEEK